MEAGKIPLLEFLSNRQQLSIPIYQRKYSWTDKECKKLWDDILRVGESEEPTHFIGSIVYMKRDPFKISRINELTIIDGQQRATTISLLISAFCDYLLKNSDENLDSETLVSYYLLNEKEIGDLHYKLILTQDDKKTLIKILDSIENKTDIEFNDNDSIRIKENFEFFRKKINKNNTAIINAGLNKLLIIYISLEPNIDNPQLIFESLNSTGLDLSQADLIRNYILMGLLPEEQTKLYDDYWHEIEVSFEKNEGDFDKFIRDYLTVKTDKVPVFRNIYTDFKTYSKTQEVNELVKDIYTYANYFKSIAFGEEENSKLKKSLDSLRSLGYDVTDPFMLHLYRDYQENKLTTDDFCEIIKYTESYLLRRLICSIPTPSLNKTFAKMYSEIDNTNHLNSYKDTLLSKENYQRMPDDEEFARNFRERDIYNLRAKNRDYIFDKFENWQFPKEIHKIDDEYTSIEHIMPQNPNLSQDWKDALGENWKEIHKKYLHTIGNLTLTGYNPELSDKSFKDKQEDEKGGYKHSIYRLSMDLKELETWNEAEIKERTEKFVNESLIIWPYPSI